MFKVSTIAGIALVGAFATTGASAHESYGQGHNNTGYSTTTYSAPTIDLGPIEYVQPNSTTQYIQPATTTTYTQPTYTQPTYTQPTYTQPTYYTTPTYTQPANTTPSYYSPPAYDASARIERRMDRQRSRIRNAKNRGDLRRGERRRLRRNMRDIRDTYRAYKGNDGVISQWEDTQLTQMLNDQSRRIRRLANNHRVQRQSQSRY